MVRSSTEIPLIASCYRKSSTIMCYDFKKYCYIEYKRNIYLTNLASDETNAMGNIKATLSVTVKTSWHSMTSVLCSLHVVRYGNHHSILTYIR